MQPDSNRRIVHLHAWLWWKELLMPHEFLVRVLLFHSHFSCLSLAISLLVSTVGPATQLVRTVAACAPLALVA